METSGTIVISATAVKGHWELLAGGHENCPVVATRSARSWPPVRPVRLGQGFTPLTVMAWERRTLS